MLTGEVEVARGMGTSEETQMRIYAQPPHLGPVDTSVQKAQILLRNFDIATKHFGGSITKWVCLRLKLAISQRLLQYSPMPAFGPS